MFRVMSCACAFEFHRLTTRHFENAFNDEMGEYNFIPFGKRRYTVSCLLFEAILKLPLEFINIDAINNMTEILFFFKRAVDQKDYNYVEILILKQRRFTESLSKLFRILQRKIIIIARAMIFFLERYRSNPPLNSFPFSGKYKLGRRILLRDVSW